jgi:hypothetical protein
MALLISQLGNLCFPQFSTQVAGAEMGLLGCSPLVLLTQFLGYEADTIMGTVLKEQNKNGVSCSTTAYGLRMASPASQKVPPASQGCFLVLCPSSESGS